MSYKTASLEVAERKKKQSLSSEQGVFLIEVPLRCSTRAVIRFSSATLPEMARWEAMVGFSDHPLHF
jgi:hypothetical protein